MNIHEQQIMDWINQAPPTVKATLRGWGFVNAEDIIKRLFHECPITYDCCGCTDEQHSKMDGEFNCGCRECFIQ